jgi:hypothetical protein
MAGLRHSGNTHTWPEPWPGVLGWWLRSHSVLCVTSQPNLVPLLETCREDEGDIGVVGLEAQVSSWVTNPGLFIALQDPHGNGRAFKAPERGSRVLEPQSPGSLSSQPAEVTTEITFAEIARCSYGEAFPLQGLLDVRVGARLDPRVLLVGLAATPQFPRQEGDPQHDHAYHCPKENRATRHDNAPF